MRKFRLNRSSTWNKEFEIRVILLVLFVSQFTLSYQKVYSSELAKNEFAINLFSQKIHPFLQKNCAECHSENSVYPAGAVHSHSNPALALETFSRFVDWSNPQNSRIVKMAKSQHFCSKYGYGCETAEKIGIEASLLIQDFVKSLKENTNTIKISNATGLNSRFLNEIDTQDISPSQDLYSFETQPISVTENMKSLYFDIGGGIEYVPRETLFLQMDLTPVSGSFYRIDKLNLLFDIDFQFPKKFLLLKGLRIFIDGRPLPYKTGWESMNRTAILNSEYSIDGTLYRGGSYYTMISYLSKLLVAAEMPLIELKSGSQVNLRFDRLKDIDNFPRFLCPDQGLYTQPIEDLNWVISDLEKLGIPIPNNNDLSKKFDETCIYLESRIHLANPRRSPILRDFNTEEEGLKFIRKFIKTMKEMKRRFSVPTREGYSPQVAPPS